MSWITKLLFSAASVETKNSWIPSVPKLLALTALIGAIGYSFTRPAVELFDDLHDSDDSDSDEDEKEDEKAVSV